MADHLFSNKPTLLKAPLSSEPLSCKPTAQRADDRIAPHLEGQRGSAMTNKIRILGATAPIRTLAILASLAILISVTGMAQTPLFRPAVGYDSGGEVGFSVAIGGVAGDANPDVVVPSYCSSGVGVMQC